MLRKSKKPNIGFNLLLKKYNLTTIKEDLNDKLIYKFWELINHDQKELFEPISI